MQNLYPSGVEVRYSTDNGSATSGSDYTDTSDTLVFTSVGQTAEVSVPILLDELSEADETVELLLEDPRSIAPIYGTGTILDDDELPKLTLGDDDQVTERGGVLRYDMTLSKPVGREVRVPFEVLPGLQRDSSGNLVDSTDCGSATQRDVCQAATPVDDYNVFRGEEVEVDGEVVSIRGEVVFEPGETSVRGLLSIGVVDDHDVDVTDRDETLTVRLIRDPDNPTFDFATPEDETAEGLILDDDLPRISISQWGAGPEGPYASNWGIRVRRRSAVPGNVTVKYRTIDDGRHIPGRYSSEGRGRSPLLGDREPGLRSRLRRAHLHAE